MPPTLSCSCPSRAALYLRSRQVMSCADNLLAELPFLLGTESAAETKRPAFGNVRKKTPSPPRHQVSKTTCGDKPMGLRSRVRSHMACGAGGLGSRSLKQGLDVLETWTRVLCIPLPVPSPPPNSHEHAEDRHARGSVKVRANPPVNPTCWILFVFCLYDVGFYVV